MTEQVTYTGTARAFSTAAHGGIIATQDEAVDVDEEVADFLVKNHDFERVDGDADPSSASDSRGSTADNNPADTEMGTDTETADSDAGEWMVALDGVGPATADKLEDAGYATVAEVQAASAEELAGVDGVSEDLAESIVAEVGDGE